MDTTRQPTIAERLYEPGLVKKLAKSLLNRGIPSRAIDDVMQQARVEVWQLFEREPHTVDELAPLLFERAGLRGIDWLRRMRREDLREDYDEVVERARTEPPAAHVREALAGIERAVAADPRLAGALEDLAGHFVDGDSYEDLAAERDVLPGRVRKGVFDLRRHAVETLSDFRLLILLATLGFIASALGRPSRHRDTDDAVPAPAPTIVAPPPAPEVSSVERAAELRKRAIEAFDGGRYGECLAALDAARDLDEPGDAAPAVRALRAAAERKRAETRHDLK